MVAARLFSILVDLGVKLWITIDNMLCWDAPKGVVTKGLQESLATHKNELLSIIRTSQKKYLDQHIDRIIHDDCLHALRQMPADSVDLLCTDAPYGLGFMNKKWDKGLPPVEIWREALRVLKPGGFAFVMSGPRQDKLMQMISLLQQAGFAIGFTSMYWTYSHGFTKRYDISKAIDKKAGAKREVVGFKKNALDFSKISTGTKSIYQSAWEHKEYLDIAVSIPATEAAKRFAGAYGGFQPKPAVEVILVAMKPKAEKTIVNQALNNGKGVTWLDDCRIPYQEGESIPIREYSKQRSYASGAVPASRGEGFTGDNRGRVPSNLLISDDILDPEGDFPGGFSRYSSLDRWYKRKAGELPEEVQNTFPFMIVPKANTAEKERGLDGVEPLSVNDSNQSQIDSSLQREEGTRQNTHPCVKPIKLMAYLVTMGSRPGDLIADPFVGSGSTCTAAKMLGRRYIGIDLEEEYCRIAEARLAAVPALAHAESLGTVNSCDIDNGVKNKGSQKKTFGRREWADKSVNCCTGCPNNCRYCYARKDALRRHQVKEYDDWKTCRIRLHDVRKKRPNYGKRVMFPSTHDITTENLIACLTVLRKLLGAGNEVLIVSKPRLAVIRVLCDELAEFRDSILFRFTITATSNAILAFWEPGAPCYEERRDALAYAHAAGFKTSVSSEPMLDADNIDQLIADLQPLVSDAMWIGMMNHMKQIRVDSPEVDQELERIKAGQTKERILDIYNRHRDNPMIKWKGEIKDIVGIPRSEKPGMDE